MIVMTKKNFNVTSNEQHPFHILDPSPWPLLTSAALFNFTLSIVVYFHYSHSASLWFSIAFLGFVLFRWFSDIVTEATFEGKHTFKVQQGIRLGMILFIVSEFMFFFSLFWAYFHCSIHPSIEIGYQWPPAKMPHLNPWGLPFLNTMLLITSGVTLTWSHKALLIGDRDQTTWGLVATLCYGNFFSLVQYYEYSSSPLCMNDGIFGSLFYMLTGFHGLHVIIGSIMLGTCLYRHLNYHLMPEQHVGYECAIYYWHFVDAVWLFLYAILYCWGR